MAMYYLMSQLPSLDAVGENTPVPITEERFYELCHRFLGKKAKDEIEKITLIPPRNFEKSGSLLIDTWNEGERNLRIALGKVRAEKMKKTFDADKMDLSVELLKTANTAVEMKDPLEAEKFLDGYRMGFLEELRPMDTFSDESVYYYALKLKLLLRSRQYNEEEGKTAYRTIYTSIINGDRLEDVQ